MQVKEVGSGASERQLREKLLDAARRREIDVVLVWRLDRWGRSVTDLLATLQELEHLGVGFVSLNEALEPGRRGRRGTFSPVSVPGQKPSAILPSRMLVWRPFRSVSLAWPKTILFGHAGFSIPYAASRRAPVRASVSR